MKFWFLVLAIGGLLWWRAKAPTPASPMVRASATGPHEGRVSAILLGDPPITADVTGRIVRWSTPVQTWIAHQGAIRQLIPTAEGLVSVSGDNTVASWTPQLQTRWRRRLAQPLNAAVLIDGDAVVAAARGTVARLGPDGPKWQLLGDHGRAAFALIRLANGNILTGGADEQIHARNPKNGHILQTWRPKIGWVIKLGATATHRIALGQSGAVALAQGIGAYRVIPCFDKPATALAIDGAVFAVGSESGAVVILDVKGKKLMRLDTGEPVLSLALKDGSLYTGGGSDGQIRIWQVQDGTPIGTLPL